MPDTIELPPPNTAPKALIDLELLVTMLSRLLVVSLMVYLFIRLNNGVMELVNKAYADDATRDASSKVITPDVMIALIGATAAQVGVSIVAIIKWLFPERRGSE